MAVTQRDILIGLGVAAAVALLLSARTVPAPALPPPAPGPGPLPPGPIPPGPIPPGPGPLTPPAPTPAQTEAIQAADRAIAVAESQAQNLPPAGREALATQLERTADALAPTSAEAASRLLVSAAKIRALNPAPAPTPTPPTLDPATEYDRLRRQAEDYLAGRGMGMVSGPALSAELESAARRLGADPRPGAAGASRVLAAYAAAVRQPNLTFAFQTPL